MRGAFSVGKHYQNHGCAVKRIKSLIPSAYFAVVAGNLVAQVLVCYGYDDWGLASSSAGSVASCLDYCVNVFTFGHVWLEFAYAPAFLDCLQYFVHDDSSS